MFHNKKFGLPHICRQLTQIQNNLSLCLYQGVFWLLVAAGCHCRPQLPSSSYLGPTQDEEAAASSVISSYGGPVSAAASQAASLYAAPSDLARDFDYSETNFISDYDIAAAYGEPALKVDSLSAPTGDYGRPRAEVLTVTAGSEVSRDYAVPRAEVISAPAAPAAQATAFVTDYSVPLASVISDNAVAASSASTKTVKAEPVAIVRSEFTGMENSNGQYHYAYETGNGISQDVTGSMKVVDEEEVYVMSGSYSYPGPDGLVYTVDWYADETGYHPSAPHLPRSVEPVTAEVREAVRQQLQFAAEQEAAAASAQQLVIVEPDSLAGYGARH